MSDIIASLGVTIKHRWYYVKEITMPAGLCVPQHRHKSDHTSKLLKGVAIVEVDGVQTKVVAPCDIIIKADKVHQVTAVTDIEWHCVHELDGDEIDHAKIDSELVA